MGNLAPRSPVARRQIADRLVNRRRGRHRISPVDRTTHRHRRSTPLMNCAPSCCGWLGRRRRRTFKTAIHRSPERPPGTLRAAGVPPEHRSGHFSGTSALLPVPPHLQAGLPGSRNDVSIHLSPLALPSHASSRRGCYPGSHVAQAARSVRPSALVTEGQRQAVAARRGAAQELHRS